MKKFQILLIALLCILLLISANYKAQSFCSDGDKDFLEDIWIDFGQPNLTNWDFGASPNIELSNAWEGITMTSDGCNIVQIYLPSSGLAGTLSFSIGSLQELTVLHLGYNDIGWVLPQSLGDLSNLTDLSLMHNDFVSGIPTTLTNLSNLVILNLYGNSFGGFLNPDFSQLANLEQLILGQNGLTGPIPTEYGSFQNLKKLNLQINNLTGQIPISLTNLSTLQTLTIGDNNITGEIPQALGDIPSLRTFHAGNTLLNGLIPSNLLISLELGTLWLYNTNLSGCIPLTFEYYCADQDKIRIEDNLFLDNDDFSTYCSSQVGMCTDHQDFVTTWKTNNIGTTNDSQVNIPTYSGETYNYDVDWEDDGVFDDFGLTGNQTHTYSTPGQYTVRIRGTFPGINFNFSGDKDKIVSIDQWGTGIWTDMVRSFFGCSNISISAIDAPNLSMITDMTSMFATSSIDYHFSNWDVSNVSTMDNMFLNVELSTPNYDALLISWSEQSLQPDVNFRATNSVYCAGAGARESLIENFNWTIFDGGACDDFIELSLKVALQGPFNESQSQMVPLIKDHASFPTIDPYETLGYNHIVGGGEQIGSGVLNQTGNGEIVDWIVIEIRDGDNPINILETHSALVRKDGFIASSETGNSGLNFFYPGSHYNSIVIALIHRNHLGVILSEPINLTGPGQEIQIDFSNTTFDLVGGTDATYDVSGVRTLISGDANHDGIVNAVDKNSYWRIQNGVPYDYLNSTGDFNLDGQVNSIDKNTHWRVSNGKSTFVSY